MLIVLLYLHLPHWSHKIWIPVAYLTTYVVSHQGKRIVRKGIYCGGYHHEILYLKFDLHI